MTRIALVVPALTTSGGVKSVARFLKNVVIRVSRFELQIISLSTSASDIKSVRFLSPRSWLQGVGVTYGTWEELPFAEVGSFGAEFEFQRYRHRAELAQLVAGCDLIQMVSGSPAWAHAVCGLGKPVALSVATRAQIERRRRDASPRSASALWRKGMTAITDRLDATALCRVDAVQLMNPWMLDYARKVNAHRSVDIRYATPGVDAQWFHPDEARSQNEPYILCVGRLDDPRKNIGLLLDAYAQLPPSLRGRVKLKLAGSSGPTPPFWSQVEALGLSEQVSYVSRPNGDELLGLYQRASVFCLPSDEEGFGMVLLEAMACGVPVVSTRSGGPDGIVTDGEDGLLVPLSDARAMASALLRLLQAPELNAAIGRSARRTIECRYDERIAGERFVEVWDALAQRARGG